jgi:hypothetical protein
MTAHSRWPRQRVFIGKDWQGRHRLYVCEDQWGQPHESGVGIKVKIATGFTWNEHCEGDLVDPSDGIPYSDDLIQDIVDKAWDAGFRPRAFEDVKNETTALRDHLKDMQTIAFKQLKIERNN